MVCLPLKKKYIFQRLNKQFLAVFPKFHYEISPQSLTPPKIVLKIYLFNKNKINIKKDTTSLVYNKLHLLLTTLKELKDFLLCRHTYTQSRRTCVLNSPTFFILFLLKHLGMSEPWRKGIPFSLPVSLCLLLSTCLISVTHNNSRIEANGNFVKLFLFPLQSYD